MDAPTYSPRQPTAVSRSWPGWLPWHTPILDGTLIAIDRVAEDRPCYCGKHKRHGVNVQVLADAAGRLIWASPALPGATTT